MYIWSEDRLSVTALSTCLYDPSHEIRETVTATLSIRSPEEALSGEALYIASFENAFFTTQVYAVELPALQDMRVLRLPARLTHISAEAFSDGTFEAVIVPDGCTIIDELAFANCGQLRYVRLPASITFIADDAFENCPQVIIDQMKN